MIWLVEALEYRALRYVRQTLAPFTILVGPNGSGKSTFLDVTTILADLVSRHGGVEEAVSLRATDVRQLTFRGTGTRFELAIEAEIPANLRARLPNDRSTCCRYEVAIGEMPDGSVGLLAETLWLKEEVPASSSTPSLFPLATPPPSTILARPSAGGSKRIVSKVPESGNDYFQAETADWKNQFRLGPRKAALANLPEDEEKWPVATWFKRTLLEKVQKIALVSDLMRSPCPPGAPRSFLPDGSNLPWVVETLDPALRRRWIEHLRTALPELVDVHVVDRKEDRKRYLSVEYSGGFAVPSWLVSDGTLRLMALTLLAYLPESDHVFLVEEPENGIHPGNLETVFQSLDSAYSAQILCATHSPVFLSLARADRILCFAKTDREGIALVRGSEHPLLRNWKKEVDLGTLLASGVLG